MTQQPYLFRAQRWSVTLSANGQLTVPAALARRLKLKPELPLAERPTMSADEHAGLVAIGKGPAGVSWYPLEQRLSVSALERPDYCTGGKLFK